MAVPSCFTNESFAPYLAAMIRSAIDHTLPDRLYDMVILAADMKDAALKMMDLAGGEENISVRRFDVTQFIDGVELFTENNSSLSIGSYFRLLMTDW